MKKFKTLQNKKFFSINNNEVKLMVESINKLKLILRNFESEIINTEQFDKINEWIGGNHEFILRYNAKRDGCNTDIFHQKCDGLSGSVIICRPKDKDIIGAYISSKILKNNNFSDDNKAFLFNLTQNFVKRNKKGYNNAIKNYSDSSYFIKFGNSCNVLILSGNCLNVTNS